jgi:Ca-activated chloride channel family protein
MLSFQHIEFLNLLFLLLVPASLLFYAFFWRRKIQKKLGNSLLIAQFIKSFSTGLFFIKHFIILIALALLIISAANPRKIIQSETKNTGVDLMFALDVSNSMLSGDIKPTRLAAAKQLIKNLTQTLNVNRIGLIVFAENALLQLPITYDTKAAEMYINQVSTDAIPEQGTSIGNALALCDKSLNLNEFKYKAVVFISDGEAHDNTAVTMAKQLHDHGVVVYCIGVGTPEGTVFKEAGSTKYMKDENGNTVISRLNESLLKNVASITGGSFFLLNNDQNVIIPALKKEFSNFEKKHPDTSLTNQYYSYYQLFLFVAILFMIIEIIIPEKKRTE